MSYGFKAFSTTSSNHLVIDDQFSTWRVTQSGVLPTSGTLINMNESFAESANNPPSVFVKIPSAGTYFMTSSDFFGASAGTVNQFRVNCDAFIGNNVTGLQYRLYRETDLATTGIYTGYGMNIFNSAGVPVFSTNYAPLVLDGSGNADTGKTIIDPTNFPSPGYYGNEYDTGAFEPFVYMSFSGKQSISPAGANRLVQSLYAAMYHTSGTLRIRWYLRGQTIPTPVPFYTYSAYTGTTINQTFFWFNGNRPA
jgi:hypothetical protein